MAYISAKRIQKKLLDIQKCHPCNCSASPKGNNIYEWEAFIMGPEHTPYAGGMFFLDIKFPVDYPHHPPVIKFRTKIYHCNINECGDIRLDILQHKWKPAWTIEKVLMCLALILEDPKPDSPLNGDAAEKYKNDREAHDEEVRAWTQRYSAA